MLEWDAADERYYQHGVDRGVLYPVGSDPVPWNGITGVNESGNGASTLYYIDGQIYLADVDATDFSGSLTAYFFPDAFAECVGFPQVAEGLFADNQKPKRFSLSYRSLIGSGTAGDMFGYQIHLIYNAMASIAQKQRKTLTNTPEPLELSFDIVATPIKIPELRPTAHLVIDTRFLTPEAVAELETMLYGDGVTPGEMPDPVTLFELLSFGETIAVTHYTATELINFKAKSANVVMTSSTTYQINNVNAVDNGDGTYDISDGGDTVVTVV